MFSFINSINILTDAHNPENNAKIKYKVPLEMEPASRPDPLKEPCVPVSRHTAQPLINSLTLLHGLRMASFKN